MAVRTLEELMEKVKSYVGDDTSDDTMAFLEDLSDTVNNTNSEDVEKIKSEYEQKISDTENTWRQRYRDRFFGKTFGEEERESGDVELTQDETGTKADNEKEEDVKDYEDLFE